MNRDGVGHTNQAFMARARNDERLKPKGIFMPTGGSAFNDASREQRRITMMFRGSKANPKSRSAEQDCGMWCSAELVRTDDTSFRYQATTIAQVDFLAAQSR